MEVTIVSWNVDGNVKEVLEVEEVASAEVLCFQETKTKEAFGAEGWPYGQWNTFKDTLGRGRSEHGVVTWSKRHVGGGAPTAEVASGRVVVTLHDGKYAIINIYGYTTGKLASKNLPEAVGDAFREKRASQIKLFQSLVLEKIRILLKDAKIPVILVGDFNATFKKHEAFFQDLNDLGMTCVSPDKDTYKNKEKGYTARVDFLFLSPELHNRLQICEVLSHRAAYSDHAPIRCRLDLRNMRTAFRPRGEEEDH